MLFDPVQQIQSVLQNPELSKHILLKSSYTSGGIKSDTTSGKKFHTVFAEAIEEGKIPLMGKMSHNNFNNHLIKIRRNLLG